jgi:hypothetical protein
VEAIGRFAREYPEVTCSFVAYALDLPTFLLCFDTPENALTVAKAEERDALERRLKIAQLPDRAWMAASWYSSYPPIVDHSWGAGYFAFGLEAELKVDEIEDLAFEDDYPSSQTDDYTEGSVTVVLWKVVERLIASGTFDQLHRSSPFRIGFELHDRPLLVLRILDWPSVVRRADPLM